MTAVRQRVRGWVVRFWDQPVIDYPALRRFASKPFARRGTHIVIEEDDEDAPKAADAPSVPGSTSPQPAPPLARRAHVTDVMTARTQFVRAEEGAMLRLLGAELQSRDSAVQWTDARSAAQRTVFAHDVSVTIAEEVGRAAVRAGAEAPAGADRVMAAMLLVVLQASRNAPAHNSNVSDQTLILGYDQDLRYL
jgi:hypothetical protein